MQNIDKNQDAEFKEFTRKLFVSECKFLIGAVSLDVIPDSTRVEVAFAGRSNVGKSSIINALTNAKNARVSNTPGRTKELNFFELGGKFTFVDMPGYGYAEAPKSMVDKWNRLIRDYLRGRPNLRRVFLLIDSRHGFKKNDTEIMELLDESATIYQIILTKIDKIPAKALESVINSIKDKMKKHPAMHPEIIATSSKDNIGIELLKEEIAKLVIR